MGSVGGDLCGETSSAAVAVVEKSVTSTAVSGEVCLARAVIRRTGSEPGRDRPDRARRNREVPRAGVCIRCALPAGDRAGLASVGGGSHGKAMGPSAGACSGRAVVVGRTAHRAGARAHRAGGERGGGGRLGAEPAAGACRLVTAAEARGAAGARFGAGTGTGTAEAPAGTASASSGSGIRCTRAVRPSLTHGQLVGPDWQTGHQ